MNSQIFKSETQKRMFHLNLFFTILNSQINALSVENRNKRNIYERTVIHSSQQCRFMILRSKTAMIYQRTTTVSSIFEALLGGGGYLFPCSPDINIGVFPCSPKIENLFLMFPVPQY